MLNYQRLAHTVDNGRMTLNSMKAIKMPPINRVIGYLCPIPHHRRGSTSMVTNNAHNITTHTGNNITPVALNNLTVTGGLNMKLRILKNYLMIL
jgi:hypothetical protein